MLTFLAFLTQRCTCIYTDNPSGITGSTEVLFRNYSQSWTKSDGDDATMMRIFQSRPHMMQLPAIHVIANTDTTRTSLRTLASASLTASCISPV